jgi:GH15 family glucan-1,4-alpha-glucosidase
MVSAGGGARGMARIEDYALIGDLETAALVGRDGSIDWLCVPTFASPACFAALLGDRQHGRWLLAPAAEPQRVSRRYRDSSLVLETDFVTGTGTVRVVDCMPPRDGPPQIVRLVQGLDGEVAMRMELIIRFDYGSVVPWVRNRDGILTATAGPDALALSSPVPTRGVGLTTAAEFSVKRGDAVPFTLTWYPSHTDPPAFRHAAAAADETDRYWHEWIRRFTYDGVARDLVLRSAITLKALTFAPTGGIVAAATTSLPEEVGGVRNWDYRYCWLRDATFTLYALMSCGFRDEAMAWRTWLLRAVAGDPGQLQVMYGPDGTRRLPEFELDWLPGYEGSRPVRIGNAATTQRQLDVYGEVVDVLHVARREGLMTDGDSWALQRAILRSLESIWTEPDEGIWEVRGPRRPFTHSKVMAWVAFDRAVKTVERFGLEGPVDRWRALRDAAHREVCERGFNPTRQAFTQFYGSDELDASLLRIPLVGFLPADDPRVLRTVAAIERELCVDGFVRRYHTKEDGRVDGLPAGEGAFLPCTFWLADNYVLQGRIDEARAVFDRLVPLANDVGLLAEEYDPSGRRQLGNFPQAITHVSLINTALNLSRRAGPAAHRPT